MVTSAVASDAESALGFPLTEDGEEGGESMIVSDTCLAACVNRVHRARSISFSATTLVQLRSSNR